ncbi:hypothetical protein Cob_v002528 [Colletotrichum orbiculare MAFF 240422]|uniref:C2H2-type domain-containing protein n=1 Tax=Colletotrichum orbiculare (strain 104-T / ATCC 96160 / CBS 514.97 / LARS 414 / MAFF 240422) TaxID=1213857 RepID=A0A484G3Y3_COLOR|nr:hypothetical protein Cob_v002528 [Colletotrichum orbiculare MAFF 240422]
MTAFKGETSPDPDADNGSVSSDDDAESKHPTRAIQRAMIDSVMSTFVSWLDVKLRVKEEDEDLPDVESLGLLSSFAPESNASLSSDLDDTWHPAVDSSHSITLVHEETRFDKVEDSSPLTETFKSPALDVRRGPSSYGSAPPGLGVKTDDETTVEIGLPGRRSDGLPLSLGSFQPISNVPPRAAPSRDFPASESFVSSGPNETPKRMLPASLDNKSKKKLGSATPSGQPRADVVPARSWRSRLQGAFPVPPPPPPPAPAPASSRPPELPALASAPSEPPEFDVSESLEEFANVHATPGEVANNLDTSMSQSEAALTGPRSDQQVQPNTLANNSASAPQRLALAASSASRVPAPIKGIRNRLGGGMRREEAEEERRFESPRQSRLGSRIDSAAVGSGPVSLRRGKLPEDIEEPPLASRPTPSVGEAYTAPRKRGARNVAASAGSLGTAPAGRSSAPKRDRPTDGGQQDDHQDDVVDDGVNTAPRSKLPRVHEDEISGAKLACPFFKHNPRKYKNKRPCCGPGWDHVHRIKEHIYRKHSLPKFSCPRCSQPFETQADLQAHARSLTPCKVSEPEVVDGITQDQEKKLRSRKKTSGKELTEAEKWKQVYAIIFPDVREREIPSPYYSTEDAQTALGGYEDYLRRELPTLVRRQLEQEVERELSFVEEGMKQKVIEIARNLQLALFKGYQQLESREKCVDRDASPGAGDGSISETAGSSSFTTTDASPSTLTTQGTTPEMPDPLDILYEDPAIPDFDFGFLSEAAGAQAHDPTKGLDPAVVFGNLHDGEEQPTVHPMDVFGGQQHGDEYYDTDEYYARLARFQTMS